MAIFVRWPGKIKPRLVLNDVASHQDWLPTLLAVAGESRIAEKLLKGHKIGAKTSSEVDRTQASRNSLGNQEAARSDPMLAAEGAVLFLERCHPRSYSQLRMGNVCQSCAVAFNILNT